MTYEVFRYIFYGGMFCTIAFLLVTVILFFSLKIPQVIGDLTGATARKAIEDIRNKNEATGEKAYKSSAVNKERGRLTDKISQSGRLIPQEGRGSVGGAMATEKISTQKLASDETSVLSTGNETTLLYSPTDGNETTVLNASTGANETTLLTPDMYTQADMGATPQSQPTIGVFVIEQEITFIHTQEVIV